MKFEKVSLEVFIKDYAKANNIAGSDLTDDILLDIRTIYFAIELPKRSTKYSAGYDFFIPYTVDFHHKTDTMIPTGIRFKCDNDKFLMCLPRSGLAMRHGMTLKNLAGVIDADYYSSANQGHIMAKFSCDEPFTLKAGTAMMQGIIMPYYKVDGDTCDTDRIGGFGSTGM